MSADVLVVEDDEVLRLALADNLRDEGYRVRATDTARGARAAVEDQAPHLMLLDIMLPDGDGYALCRELRQAGFSGMVLMLTARTLEDDLVKGFDAGADDYLKKPYKLAELLVRSRALLRRSRSAFEQPDDGALPTVGGHRIDRQARRVYGPDDAEVALTRTEFELLVHLVENRDRALTRDEILDEVWGKDVIVDARTVDNFVSSLKRKLGWSADADFRIRTIRGIGYRFELS